MAGTKLAAIQGKHPQICLKVPDSWPMFRASGIPYARRVGS